MQKQFKQLVYLGSILLIGYALQSCCLPSKLRSSQAYKQSREAMVAAPYVAIQARITYRAEGKSYKGHLKIHIHRNHRIWVSITHSWGGELLQCNITPAGVEVMNRIDRSYQYYNYAQLQADWQAPCSYDLIQAMLLGQLPHAATSSEVLSDSHQVIRQVHGNYVCTGTVDNHSQQLISLCAADPSLGDRWCIFYKYKRTYQQDLLFSEADAFFALFNCTLHYQHIRFLTQPLTFPFNRPK